MPAFIEEHAVVTRSGKRIKTPIHTFCTHGDEGTGAALAAAVRAEVEKRGIRVVLLPEMSF